jgi:DNA-binding XRE family transcriptional regulator
MIDLMNDIVQLGLKIRQARIKNKVSQQKLAEDSGLDLTTINEIENGKRNPRLFTLIKIASILKINMKELF